MKILFASYYYYFQKEVYSLIIDELKDGSSDFRFLPTHFEYGRKESLDDATKINLHGEISETTFPKLPPIVISIKKAILYFYDRFSLLRILKEWAPDIVVINNDLAGIYIRMLQDLCNKLAIPVIIVITTNFVAFKTEQQKQVKGWRWVYGIVLKIFNYHRAYYYNGNTIGTYLPNSFIAVQGNAIKRKLIDNGIDSSRITVTGNPLFDKYFALRKITRKEAMLSINSSDFTTSDIHEYKIIVYCTEVIEYIYGKDYLYKINTTLKATFDSLCNNIKIVIKLHPAESKESKKYYKELFNGDRYFIVEDINLGNLFRSASLMIAHFSATIMETIAVGTPVLMIDINCDNSRHEYIPYHDMVVAQTEEQIVYKINNLLYNGKYIQDAMNLLDEWIISYLDLPDNSVSTRRVADLIRKIGKGNL